MAIFGDSHFTKGSTPNFGPNLTKLGRIVGITKKMIWFEWAAGPGPKYGETAVFAFCRKVEKRPKIRFSLYKHPPNGSSLLIIWEKATFF